MANIQNYNKDNIPHTPSKVGVLERRIFSHTPEEAMSVGLVKACVPRKKIDSVQEKLSSLIKVKQNEKSTLIYQTNSKSRNTALY